MTNPAPTAAMVIIGNEILSGRTHDKNLNYIGLGLNAAGVRLREARVIPDVHETIIATINGLRVQYDYVFTSGGIGPTHDDITAQAVADAFGVKLMCHPEAFAILQARYKPEDFNEARQRMAYVPEGAALIPNPVSGAPGFRMENVFVMAGVPSIMQAMFDSVRHELQGGDPVLSVEVEIFAAEGTIAAPLTELQAQFAAVDIGSYPFIKSGKLGTSLVLRSADKILLGKAHQALRAMLAEMGIEEAE